jgi:hypothetical protein
MTTLFTAGPAWHSQALAGADSDKLHRLGTAVRKVNETQ